jgi:integrase
MAKGSSDDGEKRRTAGAGSVDELPSGKWRVRLTTSDGKRRPLGTFASEEEAKTILHAALVRLADGTAASVGGITLRGFGTSWMTERELSEDVRAIEADKSRWRTHIVTSPFFDWPIATISPLNVADWVLELRKKFVATPYQGKRMPKKLARKTVKEILLLLKICFDAALSPHRLIRENPAVGIKIKKELRTHEPWTYLTVDEQDRLLSCETIPEWDRIMMAFALGTGLRAGEQFNLELVDMRVDGDHPQVIVRYGSKGKPPKNGKIRHVPLFGLGLWAARRWLQLLPEYAKQNPLGLVFPGRRGGRRPPGKNFHTTRTVLDRNGKRRPMSVDVFHEHLEAAGIVAALRHDGRPVRWHDQRHTCASHLIAGWRGQTPWRLEVIRDLLGHSSISVTERYAHLSASAVREAAGQTSAMVVTGPRSSIAVTEQVAHLSASVMHEAAEQMSATVVTGPRSSIAMTEGDAHLSASVVREAAEQMSATVVTGPRSSIAVTEQVAHLSASVVREAAEQMSAMVVTGDRSSITVTERDAHPAASVVREAAEQTRTTGVGRGEGGSEGHAKVISLVTNGNYSEPLWGFAPNPAPASRSP